MKKKIKFISILLCLFTLAVNLYGLNINILILQDDGTEKISEASRVFENQILNLIFDYGHIVTNEPISLYENCDTAINTGFNAAIDGYMDYFVTIKVEYNRENSSNPDGVLLSNIKSVNYEIKRVKDSKVIYKSEKIIPKNNEILNPYAGFISFASEIAECIIKNINGK